MTMTNEPTTYRERREARAERLRGWAASREAKADAAYEKAAGIADMIPFGQPILVGHHSEGRARRDADRIDSGFRRSFEHARKAEEMTRRADNIEAAAEHAIYSDDPDAIERLTERIATLEAERDRIKAYNASCRKAAKTGGTGDLSLLDEAQREDLVKIARYAAFQLGAGNAFPSYATSNLSGNIKRNRDRLAELEAKSSAPALVCAVDGCDAVAIHRSGWGNGTTERPTLNCCVTHTNERENDGAWSRGIR